MKESDYILASNIARLQTAESLLREISGHPSIDGEKLRDAIIAVGEMGHASFEALYEKPKP